MKNKKGEDGDRDSGSEDEGTGCPIILIARSIDTTNIYLARKFERKL